MNALENFAIAVLLGFLQMVIKNPAAKAVVQNQLLGIANDIYLAYGLVPPAPPAAPATAAPAAPAPASTAMPVSET